MNRTKFSSTFKLLFQVFFSFQEFLQQHENTVKSNNQKNNCINQLLRLLLLKYTQKNDKNNKKKGSTNLPLQGKSTLQHL